MPVLDAKKVIPNVEIDTEEMERRLVILPLKAGNYGRLNAIKGRIIYQVFPNTGVSDGKASLRYYDIDKREE